MLLGASAGTSTLVRAEVGLRWPQRPVRLVNPFLPGGGTDALALPLARALTPVLGQPVVIENRGGAGGNLGAELVAKANPDGYAFLIGGVPHAIAMSADPKPGYDLRKELVPVTLLAILPAVVLVNPARLPQIQDWARFQAAVRAQPGHFSYASAGPGSAQQLAVELYRSLTQVKVTPIVHQGAGAALDALLAGQVDFMMDGLGSAMPHIRAGRLLALVVSSAKRSFALPDVPTLQEVGVKGYDLLSWYGMWAPGGTPAPIIQRMQTEVAGVLKGPELQAIWQSLGAEPGGGSSAEMGRFVDAEIRRWARVVQASGTRSD